MWIFLNKGILISELRPNFVWNDTVYHGEKKTLNHGEKWYDSKSRWPHCRTRGYLECFNYKTQDSYSQVE